MFSDSVSTQIFICIWSLGAVGVGLITGFLLGRYYREASEARRGRSDQKLALSALLKLAASTHRLSENMEELHSILEAAHKELSTVPSEGTEQRFYQSLLTNINHVMTSNRQLEENLNLAQYQLQSQAKELEETREEARTDFLCNIGNRKAIDETLDFMISKFQSHQESFGLMLIDLDHFKRINDLFGHAAGDRLLADVAKALRDCVRPQDFVGRLGGDEFVVILAGLAKENAEYVATRIRSTIECYDFGIEEGGQSATVTLSMGLAVVQPGDTATQLYDRADQALYQSKTAGRNRLHLCHDQTGSLLTIPQTGTVPAGSFHHEPTDSR